MKFGYVLENFGDKLNSENLVATTELAEDHGFHSVWTTDHILPPLDHAWPIYNNITESVITISYLSGLTSTIRLGISTLVLPRRHPILVAKQLASLDYLTKGRVMVSFGAGIAGKEFNYMNQEISNRGERFNEGLEVIKHLWAGKTTFQGKFYSFEDADFRPLPHSDIPIWIAGNSIPALKRAIKHGSGWHPVRVKNRFGPKEFKTMITPYKDKFPKEFTIAVRHTIDDKTNLSQLIEDYEKNNIDYLLLKILGGKRALELTTDEISSYI